MFLKVRRVFTVGVVVFLLGLFSLPALYLEGQCAQMEQLTEELLAAADREDFAAAQGAYGKLRQRMTDMKPRADSFLDHAVVDQAALPVEQMGVYLSAGDKVGLRAAAAELRLALSCIRSIEGFHLRMFL